MSSFSTTLLQKALWVKLQSWLKYVNGEGEGQYRLAPRGAALTEAVQPTKSFIIQKVYQNDTIIGVGAWLYTIVTIQFEEELVMIIKNGSKWGLPILTGESADNTETIRIPYSDPEFYKKAFAVIARAKERATA